MVYSLLQMQQRQTDNPETIEHLQAASQRVESIAALHEQLMKSKSGVNFKVFVTDLIDSIIKCLLVQKQVTTHLSIEPVKLPVNHYFSLSLILNEWITNSLKYLQVNEQKIMIHLNMVNRDGGIDIEYFDNGNPVFEESEKTGLGVHILHLLCRQINATLQKGGKGIYHYLLFIPHGK